MTGEKSALRAFMRRARGDLDSAARRRAHEAIGREILRVATERGARVVALYAATDGEADPATAADALLDAGCRLVWPRVEGPGALAFHEADPRALAPGFRGIPEPPAGAPAVPWEAVDLAFVPGLAFTADGERLGQGGGFYDRLLARAPRPFTLGVAYWLQLVDTLPAELHDRAVDGVLTERGVVQS
ncbi:MAG: 5-formyltetrahydrofolate cyclo-ligase [Deltaproteobacteria bacterium]|nr:5-formyltetrahydrofolate cyclo-ligase [Deltaproteobacteria bacterium]